MKSDFIVLTTNRSGSVWVMSTLNNHPQITTQGELFLPRKRVADRRWDSDFAIPRYIEAQKGQFSVRPFSVFSYLDDLYTNGDSVGFKLMYRQLSMYPEILIYLIRHKKRVIHLVRQNHFDVLVSYAVKSEIGQAHLLAGQKSPQDIQVSLDTNKLVQQMERLERKQRLARSMLRLSRLSCLEITYEELHGDQNNFQKIFDFLSLNLDRQMPESDLVKIRKGDHRQVISNYDEIKEVLASTKYASLLQ